MAVQEVTKCKICAKSNVCIYVEFLICTSCEDLADKSIVILKSFYLMALFLIIIHEAVNERKVIQLRR